MPRTSICAGISHNRQTALRIRGEFFVDQYEGGTYGEACASRQIADFLRSCVPTEKARTCRIRVIPKRTVSAHPPEPRQYRTFYVAPGTHFYLGATYALNPTTALVEPATPESCPDSLFTYTPDCVVKGDTIQVPF